MSHEIVSVSAEEIARQAEKERLSRQIANWTKEISLTLGGVAEMRDKWAARQKKCYDAHKAERLGCAKKYQETHKEEIAIARRKYYETHKAQCAAYQKKYSMTHKTKMAEYDKKYRETHKEEIAERKKKYRKNMTDGRKSDVQVQYAADGGAEANCGATS